MFFDAVLDPNMIPIFNGTPEETRKWLLENSPAVDNLNVCIGNTLQMVTVVTVKEYLGID